MIAKKGLIAFDSKITFRFSKKSHKILLHANIICAQFRQHYPYLQFIFMFANFSFMRIKFQTCQLHNFFHTHEFLIGFICALNFFSPKNNNIHNSIFLHFMLCIKIWISMGAQNLNFCSWGLFCGKKLSNSIICLKFRQFNFSLFACVFEYKWRKEKVQWHIW